MRRAHPAPPGLYGTSVAIVSSLCSAIGSRSRRRLSAAVSASTSGVSCGQRAASTCRSSVSDSIQPSVSAPLSFQRQCRISPSVFTVGVTFHCRCHFSLSVSVVSVSRQFSLYSFQRQRQLVCPASFCAVSSRAGRCRVVHTLPALSQGVLHAARRVLHAARCMQHFVACCMLRIACMSHSSVARCNAGRCSAGRQHGAAGPGRAGLGSDRADGVAEREEVAHDPVRRREARRRSARARLACAAAQMHGKAWQGTAKGKGPKATPCHPWRRRGRGRGVARRGSRRPRRAAHAWCCIRAQAGRSDADGAKV
jgi:hypothetical protein